MVVMAASKIFFVQFTVSGLADTRRWTSESEILHAKLKMYIYFFIICVLRLSFLCELRIIAVFTAKTLLF